MYSSANSSALYQILANNPLHASGNTPGGYLRPVCTFWEQKNVHLPEKELLFHGCSAL
jgi:hypothetical protein